MSARKSLSPRQRQVLRLIAAGETDKAIAANLNISKATVSAHVSAILAKLRCRSRTQAAVTFFCR